MKKIVKIKKSSAIFSWYKNKIGEVFVVDDDFKCLNHKPLIGSYYIREDDCDVIVESYNRKRIKEELNKLISDLNLPDTPNTSNIIKRLNELKFHIF